MELYLDTSDVDAVKALARIFPLAGVTTNPSIVAAGNQTLEVLLPQLQEAMGGQGRLFAQVMATTAEGMVSDARKLRAIIADIVVKVPVTAEGLAAIKLLKEEGIRDDFIVIYGGAPVFPEWCEKIGADGYAETAAGAIDVVKKLMAEKAS